MAKTKKFDLNVLNNKDKQFNEKKQILIDGKYIINVDQKFRKTKLQQLLIELEDQIKQLHKEKLNHSTLLQALVYIQQMLIVKYFTDIPFPADLSPVDYVKLFEKFMDNGVLQILFENGFVKEEVEQLYKDIAEITKENQVFYNQIGELFTRLELENREEVVQ